MPTYCGIDGVVRKLKEWPAGVGGAVRQQKEVWAGVDGVKRKIFSSLPAPNPVFSKNDWETIILACETKTVPATWVADGSCYKDMVINGKSYRIDIIGKDHDTYSAGGTAPLTFHLHDCYGTSYNDYRGMNKIDTNSGGWEACAMRTEYLPAILNLFPSNIKNAIKSVVKKTSAGSSNNRILSTNDKLFLLSEVELFGNSKNSYAGEGKQYYYYAVGNSKKWKEFTGNYSWYVSNRSPKKYSSDSFCGVDGLENSGWGTAAAINPFPFGFCF